MALIVGPGDFSNGKFLREEGSLRYLAAKSAVFTVGQYEADYQLVHLFFSKKDGSIYVDVPFFPSRSAGLLTTAQYPAEPPYTLSLTEGGKVTNHLVKYSHHPDGRAHFSQDGKIKTIIKRQSFKLSAIGEVFQIHFYHVKQFPALSLATQNLRRPYLLNRFKHSMPNAIAVTGEWRRKSDIIANIEPPGQKTGPVSQVKHRRTGNESLVTFLGQPPGFPFDHHVLMLSCYPTTELANVTEPAMVFLGGYDHHEVPEGTPPSRMATGVVAWLYPIDSADELAAKIGSVDFQPPESKS